MISKVVLLSAALLCTAIFVKGTSLNGSCKSDDHCGAVDSYCNNGTCTCRPNFAYLDDACIEVVEPRMSCVTETQCQPRLGNRSICKDGSCACKPYHHLHDNNCIKNRGLHEICDADYQCYWGQDMLDRMGCIDGKCTCKPGYRPHHPRRCESGANSNFVTSTATILIVTLLNKLF